MDRTKKGVTDMTDMPNMIKALIATAITALVVSRILAAAILSGAI